MCLENKNWHEALAKQQRLKEYTATIVRLFEEYIDAITAINKGKLWKRWRYGDHWSNYGFSVGLRPKRRLKSNRPCAVARCR